MYLKKIITIIVLVTVSLLYGCGGGSVSTKAEIKQETEKNIEAIPFTGGYLAASPEAKKSPSKLGFWYLRTGRVDKAVAEFEAALKKEPGDPFSIYYLGLAYLNKEDFEKTIQIWQGYRNSTQPLVEQEIRSQLTLLQIAYSHKAALNAITEEKKLATLKPDSNTVAVCYYQDLSPDKSLRAFQKGLAAMVITDLSKVKSVKVVERVRLQALLEEMKLGQTGIVDPKTAPRVGYLLGAENIVVGNLSSGSIRAVTTLASSGKGNVKGSASASVDKNKFFELPMLIVRDTAKILGITLSDDESKAIGVPHTKVYNALIYYGNALDALDSGKWKEAYEFFNMAYREDPEFDLAKEGLATCPGIDSTSLNSLLSISGARLSGRIEAAVSAAESSQAVVNESAPEVLRDSGYIGSDTVGIDLGAIGSSGVNLEGVVPDIGKIEPGYQETYAPSVPEPPPIVQEPPPIIVPEPPPIVPEPPPIVPEPSPIVPEPPPIEQEPPQVF